MFKVGDKIKPKGGKGFVGTIVRVTTRPKRIIAVNDAGNEKEFTKSFLKKYYE